MKSISFGLRDLLMYVFPGFLTIVIFSRFFNLTLFSEKAEVQLVNIILIFSLSYLIGILMRGIILNPIISYMLNDEKNYLDPRYYFVLLIKPFFKDEKNNMFIGNILSFSDKIKEELKNRIKLVFGLDDDKIFDSKESFSLCSRYVDNYATENGIKQVKRNYELGSYLLTISLPIILFEVFYIVSLEIVILYKVLLCILLSYLTMLFLIHRYLSYRNAWIKNVYRLFIAITNKEFAKVIRTTCSDL